ncbi:MAG: DUF4836 family protein [Ferruginibacter sp.]|nr:hypothetical protein [Ferruginibacter sp.]
MMKKRIFSVVFTAFATVILLTACSKKSNKQGRYIPENAGFVVHINGEALNNKLTWDEIKQNEFFKEMYKDSAHSAFAKTILDNPENSGVNIKSDLIIFMVKDTANSFAVIEGIIKDQAKFKQMLKDANKDATETVKNEFTFFANENTCVAYNKEIFIATTKANDMNKSLGNSNFSSITNAENLIALKEGISLGRNEKFSALIAEKADAHFWINAQHLNVGDGLSGMAAMANLNKLYDGAITAGTINFENGKININAKSYAGKEITDLYKKYSGGNIDNTMIKNIPSQNVAGLFALHFKPEGIKELLKILNIDGLVNLGASQTGFNLDDFIKANKGDILFAVTDLKKDSTDFGANANYIFAASIGEKNSFNKLINAAKKMSTPMLGATAMTEKISFNTNEKYFVLSNNKTNTDAYLTGSANSTYSFLDKITGGSFGGYVNFQYVINNFQQNKNTTSFSTEQYNANIKMWDNLLISGGNFKDGAINQHWEINLMDKTTNSLKQLNNYTGIMAAIDKKKKLADIEKWKTEDVMADEKMLPLPTEK